MNINTIPTFDQALAQSMEQFQANREADVVKAMTEGQSYTPLLQAKTGMIALFARQRDIMLMQIIRDTETARTQLIDIIRDIQTGKTDPKSLSVTDDGVTAKPERPKQENSNGSNGSKSHKEPALVG